MIYHWCPEADWEASTHEYRPAGFEREGFVHCSFLHQVEETASRHDPGRGDLVLLCIDARGLPVVTEDCYQTGQEYPHVYSAVPTAAVRRVVPFPPEPDGSFRLPPGIPPPVSDTGRVPGAG
ncbi:MAG: DUF952 domain-containing protein [Actinomycetota bacterium]